MVLVVFHFGFGLERVQELEAEGLVAVSECFGGPSEYGGSEACEFPVHGERRFGVEEEGTGVGSRDALHGEPGSFGGDEAEDRLTLQARFVGLLGVQSGGSRHLQRAWISDTWMIQIFLSLL